MSQEIVVITGAPSSGKTTLINELKEQGFYCFEEISRKITLEAQKKGIDQLFLKQPLLFSDRLLEGRLNQLLEAQKTEEKIVFLDRGIPDIIAYMDYVNANYPYNYINSIKNNRYSKVFLLPPWKEIYTNDQARYESYDEAEKIHLHLLETYQKYDYEIIIVPTGTVSERVKFIHNHL
ncbi:MAG: AAA family ATPase [Flavobacterium sp.]